MFPRNPSLRNRTGAFLACAFLGGCAAQTFLRVERVTLDERVTVFLGGGGNSVVQVSGREAFLVDPKFLGMARQLRVDVEEGLVAEVRRILVTHSHPDHAGGLGLYPRAGAVLVHPRTRARLEADGHRAAFVEVEHEVQLTLGGERVQVLYLGRGHTDGDLVALLDGHRLLVAGDLVTVGYEPNIDVEAGGAPLEWAATLDRLLELRFERLVPGHGPVTTRAAAEHLRDYLRALEAAVRTARARGLDEAGCVREVTVAGFDDLAPLPGGKDRALNVRRMFHALEQAARPDGGSVAP